VTQAKAVCCKKHACSPLFISTGKPVSYHPQEGKQSLTPLAIFSSKMRLAYYIGPSHQRTKGEPPPSHESSSRPNNIFATSSLPRDITMKFSISSALFFLSLLSTVNSATLRGEEAPGKKKIRD
jgi:hypothetical protein